jgi:competence protein ComGC
MTQKKHAARMAFTLVEIMIIVGIIALLLAVAIPNIIRSRTTSQTNACISNLKQLDSAKHQWAVENGKTDSDAPTPYDLQNYLRDNLFPSCPASGSYQLNLVSTEPTCSIAGHVLPQP